MPKHLKPKKYVRRELGRATWENTVYACSLAERTYEVAMASYELTYRIFAKPERDAARPSIKWDGEGDGVD